MQALVDELREIAVDIQAEAGVAAGPGQFEGLNRLATRVAEIADEIGDD